MANFIRNTQVKAMTSIWTAKQKARELADRTAEALTDRTGQGRVNDGVERDLLQKLKLLGGYFSDSGIQTEILEQQDIVRLCNLVNNPAYVHLEDSGINAAIPILESVGVA